ncbi:MAG TPA: hypothetical protein VJ546_09905, partial [Bacillales bacterium]|nr:hypothetical protein [Bacillales bacterium]
SLISGISNVRKHKKPVMVSIKAIFINFMILGFGSLWWFLTETDGLSQGIGVLIYFSSMIAISIMNIISIYIFTRKNKNK